MVKPRVASQFLCKRSYIYKEKICPFRTPRGQHIRYLGFALHDTTLLPRSQLFTYSIWWHSIFAGVRPIKHMLWCLFRDLLFGVLISKADASTVCLISCWTPLVVQPIVKPPMPSSDNKPAMVDLSTRASFTSALLVSEVFVESDLDLLNNSAATVASTNIRQFQVVWTIST